MYANQKKEEGKLSVTEATLTIVTQSGEKEYDGTALTAEGSISGFVNNETATFTVTGSQTLVGESDNTYSLVWDGTARESDYKLAETIGTLKVTQTTKELAIESSTKSWQYDGTVHTDEVYTVTFGGEAVTSEDGYVFTLPTGDKVTITATAPGVKDYDESYKENNTYTYVLENADQYANVTTKTGTLSITKAPLTITADSDSKEYDGTPLTNDGFTNSDLVKGDSIESVTVVGSITEVGTEENIPSDAIIKNEDGDDVTKNYEITYVNGELEITQSTKELVIESSTKSWEYDGQLHTDEVYSVTFGGEEVKADESGKVFTLPTGDKITITATAEGVKDYSDDYKENNTYTYVLENEDQFANVTAKVGTLSIYRKAVTITALDADKTYDGKALTQPEFTATELAETDDHEFTVVMTDDSTITNVGEQPNVIATVDGVEVKTGEETAVGNYLVTTVDGTLTVEPKKVTITAQDAEKVYDGKALTQPEFTASELEEGDDHEFTVVMTDDSTITNVGEQANVIATVDGVAVKTGEETAVGNYLVTTVDGTLTVTKREITVTVEGNSDVVVYDGEEHTVEGYELSSDDELFDEDSVVFDGEAVATGADPGVYNMGLGEDQFTYDDDNFTVTFVVKDGELTINAPDHVNYKVEHYLQDLEGEGFTLAETENLSGEFDEVVKAQPKDFEGFTFDDSIEGTVLSGTLKLDDQLVLKLYYTRDTYTIRYVLNGGIYDGSEEDIVEYHKYGEVITIHEAPTREGYDFDYWEGSKHYPGDQYEVIGDHTFTAQWNKTDVPETSDASNIAVWASMFGISMVNSLGLAYVSLKRKKEEEE